MVWDRCGGVRFIFFNTLPAIVIWNSLHLTCVIIGEYLCLAEVLVGKTGLPGVKTTANGVKGLCPLKVRRGSPYCVPHSIGFGLLSQVSKY